ncbi:hypothetical protein C1H46_009505 [Malus baccata]|uniref:Uncharacterized protein n=1 Tax=Malus baccata TaxID=106549 RepID=A0A540N1H2_MALBA|nr:hypothetical protein C1H46_009505 [Malus baccata]
MNLFSSKIMATMPPSSLQLPNPFPLASSSTKPHSRKPFFSFAKRLINWRIAVLGPTALLLVELATGKSVLKHHTPSFGLVQVYFVAAVAAVYIKYEKEKVSVWPQSAPPKE